MTHRKLFIAGASGATGQQVVSQALARKIDIVPHYRPKRAAGTAALPPGAAICELSDASALEAAMRGCTTVLQLIGTMKKRFAQGDTYETSDIGTTRALVQAAKAVGVDHVLVLSSTGAGHPRGAYLHAKAAAERIAQESGISTTVFRPSLLVGGDRAPRLLATVLKPLLGNTRYGPITLEDLAAALLNVALANAPLGVALEGPSLFEQVSARR